MSGHGPLDDNEPMAIATRQFMEMSFPQCQIEHLGLAEVGHGAGEHYEIDVWMELGIIRRIVLYHATKEDDRSFPHPWGATWSNGKETLQVKEIHLSNGMEFVPHDQAVENAIYSLYALKEALSDLG